MDKIDQNIIRFLRRDADISNVALAEKVNLSPSSCLRRVQRLKRDGVIKKTVCVIDERAAGRPIKAVVEVALENHGNSKNAAFHKRIQTEESIMKAYRISGENDMVLFLNLADMEEYQSLCDRLFNNDDNVLRFYTSFVLESIKDV